MSRLYLITGFLGAGKTTFLKQFMKQFSSERMHIIVNEFGKEGIDGEPVSYTHLDVYKRQIVYRFDGNEM